MSLDPKHHVDLANGVFARTSKRDLDTLFATFAGDANRDRLVVHFHGGLVNRNAGLRIAERLLPIYRDATGYPVFFIWHAGLLEVISSNVRDIAAERIFARLRDRLLQMAAGKAKERPGARSTTIELDALRPFQDRVRAEEQQPEHEPLEAETARLRRDDALLTDAQIGFVQDELERDPVIQRETAAIAEGQRQAGDTTRAVRSGEVRETRMSGEVLYELAAESGAPGERSLITSAAIAKRGVSVLIAVLKRFAARRDHGIYPTVVEELLRGLYLAHAGGVVWKQMKQDTADAFGGDPQQHGGTAFLEGLGAVARGGAARTILVGHSTGAVYISELLRHADAVLPPGLKFDVLLLAPACTFKLFERTLIDQGHRIGNLRIFTMDDALERRDRLVPGLYPRSLLYFVSGVVEEERDQPLLGMNRFYRDDGPVTAAAFPEVDRVRRFLAENESRVVWSVAAGAEGLRTAARRHGDFDNDGDTLTSIAHIIRAGFV